MIRGRSTQIASHVRESNLKPLIQTVHLNQTDPLPLFPIPETTQ
jgi:hypothetical protein